MNLLEFYNLVVKLGVRHDPRRNKAAIKSYPDTAILHGNADTKVKKIMVGIDIEIGELLIADKIRNEQGLDLVLAHHPEGSAWAHFYEVMILQIDMLVRAGVPEPVARSLLMERKDEVERRILPNNHMRSVDAARLLKLPFMCVHTPADNQVAHFLENLLQKEKPGKLSDIVKILTNIPEYRTAINDFAGPRIILGDSNKPVGKIFVEMTGGTEGSKEVFDKLYKKGIRTLVCMHLSEEHFKKVKDVNLNVVIAGHISSDALGLNLLLDAVERKIGDKLEIVDCSGFRRVSRNN